ncbi:hypothetical protein FPOAC2_09545 [Fusarium poae]
MDLEREATDTEAGPVFPGGWLWKVWRTLYFLAFLALSCLDHGTQTSKSICRFLFFSTCHSFAGNIICASHSPFCHPALPFFCSLLDRQELQEKVMLAVFSCLGSDIGCYVVSSLLPS